MTGFEPANLLHGKQALYPLSYIRKVLVYSPPLSPPARRDSPPNPSRQRGPRTLGWFGRSSPYGKDWTKLPPSYLEAFASIPASKYTTRNLQRLSTKAAL